MIEICPQCGTRFPSAASIEADDAIAQARREAYEDAIDECRLTMNDTDHGYVCLKVEKRIRARLAEIEGEAK